MGVEVIDYTYLQKRGLVKKEDNKKANIKMTSDGFLDLEGLNDIESSGKNSEDALRISEPANNNAGSGVLSFFENIGSNASNNAASTGTSNTDSNLEVNALRLKMDDLEYRLGSLIEKIEQISSRLLEFERNAVKG